MSETLTQNDLWTLILCSVRYSFRRQTYMPSLVMDITKKYSNRLTDYQLKQLKEEIGEELDREKRSPGYLGMQCDVNTWINFYNWTYQEIDRRHIDEQKSPH